MLYKISSADSGWSSAVCKVKEEEDTFFGKNSNKDLILQSVNLQKLFATSHIKKLISLPPELDF